MDVTLGDCCVLTSAQLHLDTVITSNVLGPYIATASLHDFSKCKDRAVLMNQATVRYFSPLDEGTELNVGQFFIKQKFKVIP